MLLKSKLQQLRNYILFNIITKLLGPSKPDLLNSKSIHQYTKSGSIWSTLDCISLQIVHYFHTFHFDIIKMYYIQFQKINNELEKGTAYVIYQCSQPQGQELNTGCPKMKEVLSVECYIGYGSVTTLVLP